MKKFNGNVLPTWDELVSMESGTIIMDWITDDNLRCLIVRGPNSLCAYLGVPKDHYLAGIPYDKFDGIGCHYGLTFGQYGDGEYYPEGWYFFGWDYGHLGDYCFYFDNVDWRMKDSKNKKWLVQDVVLDLLETLDDFKLFLNTNYDSLESIQDYYHQMYSNSNDDDYNQEDYCDCCPNEDEGN